LYTRHDFRTTDPAPHLVPLGNSSWAIWNWSCLRAAGFPAHKVLSLATPRCAAAADAVLVVEQAIAECTARAIGVFRGVADRVAEVDARKAVFRAIRALDQGRIPQIGEDGCRAVSQELRNLHDSLDVARRAFAAEFAAGAQSTSAAIRAVARESRFREALLMQNRAGFRRVSHLFEAAPAAKRGWRERQAEHMVANYLQRYCVKNDTIGFFGPVGWAKISAADTGLSVAPGHDFVAESHIYFENWCIEALAEKLAEDPALRVFLAPRRLPDVVADGREPREALLLSLCDGERTGYQIAAQLAGTEAFADHDEVYRTILELVQKKYVSWALDFPLVANPEQLLRRRLDGIEDAALRAPALAALDELEEARDDINAAFGDANRLDEAIGKLDHVFEELTGRAGNRLGGKMYASRTLFYQDCRRDIELTLGALVLEPIAEPLSMVLASARWYSCQAAQVCRDAFTKSYARLARRPGDPVDFMRFFKYAQLQILTQKEAMNILTPVQRELQARWQRILGPVPKGGRMALTSAMLLAEAEAAFAAPGPGWPLARHHSPDIMIAARSIDEINQGNCVFVLGETHATLNTLTIALFFEQHPVPAELLAAIAADFPVSHPSIVFPRSFPRVTNRTTTRGSARNRYIEVARDSIYPGDRAQALAASSLVVVPKGDRLLVATKDGTLEYNVIDALGDLLTLASLASLDFRRIFASGSHTPRISIDRLVIARESWTLPVKSLPFLQEENEATRFRQVRAWMRAHRMPRFVFFKVAGEVKPVYLDFESPIYIDIMAKLTRQMLASEAADGCITVSEMLPTHEELWLPDAEGNLYTGELRMVAKDLMSAAR
jgi:hypothetical protein